MAILQTLPTPRTELEDQRPGYQTIWQFILVVRIAEINLLGDQIFFVCIMHYILTSLQTIMETLPLTGQSR